MGRDREDEMSAEHDPRLVILVEKWRATIPANVAPGFDDVQRLVKDAYQLGFDDGCFAYEGTMGAKLAEINLELHTIWRDVSRIFLGRNRGEK